MGDMRSVIFALFTLTFAFSAEANRSKAPEGAKAFIISPTDGDKVRSPVTIKFGLEGMGVAPAGVKHKHTGHHHLLINVEKLPRMNAPLPANPKIVHFGGGQTQVTKDLPVGEHTLQILLGDHLHIPHDPPVLSEKITIEVVE